MKNVRQHRGATIRKAMMVLTGLAVASCATRELEVLEPETEVVSELESAQELVIYDQAEVSITHTPVPGTDELEEPCPCECVLDCEKSAEKEGQLHELLSKMQDEANRRAEAAAEAAMTVGLDLMEYEKWETMIKGLVDLLSSPTLVIVQMPTGSFKKVKLEELSDLDVSSSQVFTIKSQVSAKMKAALSAQMESYGVPATDAKKLSSHMMDTYLSEL